MSADMETMRRQAIIHRGRQARKPRSRAIAMRTKCMDCSAWQENEVRDCVVVACPLWPWRMGGKVDEMDLDDHFAKVRETPLV